MTQAIGILELTSIARGMELGRRHAEKRERTAPALQNPLPREIPADARRRRRRRAAGNRRRHRARWEMLVDSLVLANIHPSVLPAISGLNVVGQRAGGGDRRNLERGGVHQRRRPRGESGQRHPGAGPYGVWYRRQNATWWWRVISPMSTTPSRWPATAQARKDYWFTGQ
ncbi:propanediol utilization polyhedral body protein PduT [Klebsiella pneumoniae]|uniref:Propanediol utilization polyhedral body protein PduT n=1 Tax=Klebsiella pneumoniae TaxID=573 RepID=A0A377WSV6_KLEPN|nr:propanediol utilization polyhedral body protein PduT [Klebsiella pneumoniae]